MKKIILVAVTFLSVTSGIIAQNVTIPDANFKTYLIGQNLINTNGDTEIQVSEANAFTGTINCSSKNISDLTGIEAFESITRLYCYFNSLTSLNLSNNTSLTHLRCHSNDLTSLDLTNNTSLEAIRCYSNSLTSLNIANGNNNNMTYFDVSSNPNLTCITVDDVSYSNTNWSSIDSQMSFSSNCSNFTGLNKTIGTEVKIYPNPVQNELFIEGGKGQIEIIDFSGKVVKNITNSNTKSINISDLYEGIYILKLTTENGIYTDRLIKN